MSRQRGSDGRLRVDLLHAKAEPPRRFVAVARSAIDARAPEFKLLAEASGPRDPQALSVVRGAPWQLRTWGADRAPYIVRIAPSPLLHPELPPGLVLGRLDSLGYLDRNYVLRRFVEYRWHPRSLVRVGILFEDDEVVPHARDFDYPAKRRSAVDLLWISPAGLGYRRAIVRGRAVAVGAAVLDGLRCVGLVESAGLGLGLVASIGDRGQRIPVIWHDGRRTRALLLRGLGLDGGTARFWVEHPRDLAERSLLEGRVLSGAYGPRFPAGLLIGRVLEHEGRELMVEVRGSRAWPDRLDVPARSSR